MDVKVRSVELEDLKAVVDIQVESWKASYKGIIEDSYLDAMDKNAMYERRKRNYKDSGFIVADIDGDIVGFCRYTDNVRDENYESFDCELCALYVKNGYNGRGIGKAMMNYVKDYFRSSGKKNMILWCLEENYKARGFYEKMGGSLSGQKYKEIGEKTYSEIAYGYYL